MKFRRRMNKVFLCLRFLAALLLIGVSILFIGGSCSYKSSAGPMNFDFSMVSSLIGFSSLIGAIYLMKKHLSPFRKLTAILLLLYALGLYAFGNYVIETSKMNKSLTSYENDAIPPSSGSLAIYHLSILGISMAGFLHLIPKNESDDQ